MTLKRLAAESNTPYRSLQNYLARPEAMPAGVLHKLAALLGVTSDWLFTGKSAHLDVGTVARTLEALDNPPLMQLPLDLQPTLPQRAVMFDVLYRSFYSDRFPGPGSLSPPKDTAPQPHRPRPRPTKAP